MSAAITVAPAEAGSAAFVASVRKELHESLKMAAVGFVVVGVGLLFTTMLARSMSSVGSSGTAGISLSFFTLTSAFAALLIGRAQIVRERRGDEWAFLTHRPVDRATLFWAKAVAGMVLYLLAAGVPITIALVQLATPGHRPMPFDVRMTLPDIADLLCGLVYYFAALLFTMRKARWYASQLIPIGAAILCSSLVIDVSTFAAALAIIALGITVFATAARGAFIAGGDYEPQPMASRASLGLTLIVGFTIVGGIVSGIVGVVFTVAPAHGASLRTNSFEITRDGSVVQVVSELHALHPGTDIVEVKDLAGRPIARYNDSLTKGVNLSAGVISTAPVALNPNGDYMQFVRNHGYRGLEDIFVPLPPPTPTPTRVSWYYMRRLGLIAGYDNATAQLLGWIGPDGFTAGTAMPAHHFDGPLLPYTEIEYKQPLITFADAVYRVDLKQKTIRKIFSAPVGEPIVGAAGSGDSTVSMVYGPGARFDAIATTKNIYVQSAVDGTPELTVPRDSTVTEYGSVIVSRAMLAPGAPTILRYQPGNGTLSRAAANTAPDRVVEINAQGVITNRVALVEPKDTTQGITDWGGVIVAGLATPITQRVAARFYARARHQGVERLFPPTRSTLVEWLLSLVASVAAALIAFVIARTYAFVPARMWLWTVLGAVLGFVGLLVMLSVMDWPAREVCPTCGKKRVVTREHCEHCGAVFPPPTADGTEIFESAA